MSVIGLVPPFVLLETIKGLLVLDFTSQNISQHRCDVDDVRARALQAGSRGQPQVHLRTPSGAEELGDSKTNPWQTNVIHFGLFQIYAVLREMSAAFKIIF